MNITFELKGRRSLHRPIDSTERALLQTFAAKLPQLNADMNHPQFSKFNTYQNEFKRITNIRVNQTHVQLYSSCDNYVR